MNYCMSSGMLFLKTKLLFIENIIFNKECVKSVINYSFQGYFEYILEKHKENTNNPSIRIYVKKIENRITFKIKTEYYLELLTPETMKLLGSTENKITKNKNGKNAAQLQK